MCHKLEIHIESYVIGKGISNYYVTVKYKDRCRTKYMYRYQSNFIMEKSKTFLFLKLIDLLSDNAITYNTTFDKVNMYKRGKIEPY